MTSAAARAPSSKQLSAIAGLVVLLATLCAAADSKVERIGALTAKEVSPEVQQAVEDKGYRVTLADGWTAEFWFARELKTATKDAAGALYPELSNAEFVGVANFAKGMTDYRGQAIPAGYYTLRYATLPQDGNHMGVAPNPDFLLAISAASDPNPQQNYLFKKLAALSAKTTGVHPAVIALDTAGEPGQVSQDASQATFTVAIPRAGGEPEKLGILVKGSAPQ